MVSVCGITLYLLLILITNVLSYQPLRSFKRISTILQSSNGNNDNIVNALEILKTAALTRKGEVVEINKAFNTISSNSNSKLLVSDVSMITGDYELVYSSLLPFGFFPIKEITTFLPTFKLTSSFLFIPFGGFEGVSTIKSKTPAEITFYNTLFKLGLLEVPITEIKEKTYRYLHIDNDEGYMIALSLSSSSSSLSTSSGTLLKKL